MESDLQKREDLNQDDFCYQYDNSNSNNTRFNCLSLVHTMSKYEKQTMVSAGKQLERQIQEIQSLIQDKIAKINRRLNHHSALQKEYKQKCQSTKAKITRNAEKILIDKQEVVEQNAMMARQCGQFQELGRYLQNLKETKQALILEIEKAKYEYEANNSFLMESADKFNKCKKKIETNQMILQQLSKNRKILTDELHNMIGNIRVYLRIRPTFPSQMKQQPFFHINGNIIKFTLPKNQKSQNFKRDYSFAFENIFRESQSQQQIFDEFQTLVQSVLIGKNVCIFAYGQTGSGKTFTMQGNKSNPGIIPKSLTKIFQQKSLAEQEDWRYQIYVESVEIYNEEVKVLLPKEQGEVKTVEEIEKLINICNANRSVAETNCNQRSSRSHLIFTIKLTATNQAQNIKRNSQLCLVDLAGSQRVDLSNVQGERLKETKFINSSLTQLGIVIQSIAQKRNYIPYRNSKLTTFLEPVLSGESKTVMMVCISPMLSSWNQTSSSLSFAEKVKKVTTSPAGNQKELDNEEDYQDYD